MTPQRHPSGDRDGSRRALVVCVLLVVAIAPALAAPAAADHDDGNGTDSFVATQGDECVEVAVLGDGSQSVEEFYDYRWEEPGQQFSSYGTTHLQQTDVSQVFLYHGSDGVSLVALHDVLTDDEDEAGHGGGATLEFQGLPDGEFAVMDDDYDEAVGGGPDDRLQHDGATATVDWVWVAGRTDGGAFRGVENLGQNESIAIDGAFGPDSWAGQRGFDRADHADDWRVRYGTARDETHSISPDQRLTIERGTCDGTSLTASLVATPHEPETGQQVTLEATTTADGAEYRWDVDGDGEHERTTDSPTTTTAYDEPGAVEPAVTVVAGDQEATASERVEVVDLDAPRASVSAPETATLGSTVTLDASETTADRDVEHYRWDVGDDGDVEAETDDPTFEYDPEETGELAVTVTVVDEAGEQDVATTSVQVVDETPPVAVLDAPAAATVGESITVDGSASTDADAIADYEWTFGDGERASGATATHAYDDAGTYEVSLTVTDASGNENRTTTTVEVEADGEEDGSDDGDGDDGDSSDDDGDSGDGGDGDSGDDDDGDSGDGDDGDSGDGDDGDSGDDDGGRGDGDEGDDGDGEDDDTDGQNGSDDDGDGDSADGDDAGGSPSIRSSSSRSRTDGPDAELEATGDHAYELTVEDGEDGDEFEASVDAEGPLVAVEAELTRDVEEWATTLEGTPSDAVGVDGAVRYRLEPDEGDALEDVTYEFEVPLDDVEGDAEDLAVAGREDDDGWTDLDAEVGYDGRFVEVTAESDAFQPVALGTGDVAAVAESGDDASALAVTELDVAEETTAGEALSVAATVRNEGPVETTETVAIEVGDEVHEESVTVPAGETATVAVEHGVEESGTYDVAAGDSEATVEVAAESEETHSTMPVGGATLAAFAVVVLGAVALVAIGRYVGVWQVAGRRRS